MKIDVISEVIADVGEPLQLSHRRYVEPLLARLNVPLSEYCFANLYLFRAIHRYRIVREPVPHILGVTYDGVSHAMPLVSENCYEPSDLLRHAACIFPLTHDLAARAGVEGFPLQWRDDDSDYVYDGERLALMQGKALRIKRQEAESLVAEEGTPRVAALSVKNRGDALSLLDLWSEQKGGTRGSTDYAACREALHEFDGLDLTGMLFYGRARPLGFLITSRLGKDGAAVHFAKGDRSKTGVYPYMFSRFASECGAQWLNFEQDLGNPGLRRAKLALAPARRLRKYRVTARGHATAVAR